ncbi:GntR family transcriptional regulator [Cellulomonas sp. URHE0023]|uniref:GntR family transcriptional regulator n=1 Tax=Cellulomonas sp. URHE0023 TaxID=1380354 RepID=UPI000A658383|nr:GntR family transcriptional regulator [Cellulomonas sp. URHE0023]
MTHGDEARTEVLCARLRALLDARQLDPGERLGDERSLAAELGVTRTALRHALDRLQDEGLVRRTIGRTGGVVATDRRIERNLSTLEGLPDIARHQGVVVETSVLHARLTFAAPRERRLLELAEGAAVHEILRVRSAGGRPLSLETSHLPAAMFPGLAAHDLTSLYRTLRTAYGVVPAVSDESLELDGATPVEAALLGVEPGTPLIHVRRLATTVGGRPFEVAHEQFVGDRMRFHLRKYGFVRHEREPAPHEDGTHPATVASASREVP